MSDNGTVQTYFSGGMPSSTIDITSDRLIMKDLWGKELEVESPYTTLDWALSQIGQRSSPHERQ